MYSSPVMNERYRDFLLGCIVALGIAAVPGGADAQTLFHRGPPANRFVHRNSLAVRYNPLGLIYDGRFAYRRRLYENESTALRDNFVSIGVAPGASPAFGRVGVVAEVQPLSVLTLYVLYEAVMYFGALDHLQSFPSASSDFSDDTLDDGDEYVTFGSQLILGANVQLKVDDFVLRTQFKLIRGNMALNDGDRTYYDPFYDVLAPDRGWFVTNDADVLYQPAFGLVAGVRYTATRPFYRAHHFAPGETQGDDHRMHRVGPLVGWAIRQRDGDSLNLLVFAAAQWWVVHRYRAGEESSAGLPMLAAGVQATGDLIPID